MSGKSEEKATASGTTTITRKRTGCLTCRQRKVKCDEQQPVCRKCTIKHRPCVWQSSDAEKRGADDEDEQFKLPPKKRVYIGADFLPSENNGTDMVTQAMAKTTVASWIHPSTRLELMTDPTFMQPYFPCLDERLMARQFLSKTVNNLMARCPRNYPWNPFVSVLAPLAFENLPGVSPAADALRLAMVTAGTVHARHGKGSNESLTAKRIVNTSCPRVVALIRTAVKLPNGQSRPVAHTVVEQVLCALLLCIISASMSGDDAWHTYMRAALNLIMRLGGPEQLLSSSGKHSMSPTRFVLEQIAIRDTMGCMTTGQAPTLFAHPFSPWFFYVEKYSNSDAEWESVERMFGMSRGMVDFVARSCVLLAKVYEPAIDSDNEAIKSIVFEDMDSLLSILGETEPKIEPSAASASTPTLVDWKTSANKAVLESEAESLMAELEVWDTPTNFIPYHHRTQYGNHLYRHAMRIRLLTEVFNVKDDDPRVTAAVRAIIELSKETLARSSEINWLSWPIIVAGLHLPPGDPARSVIIDLLVASSPMGCFDTEIACRMVQAFWDHADRTGADFRQWRDAWIQERKPFLV